MQNRINKYVINITIIQFETIKQRRFTLCPPFAIYFHLFTRTVSAHEERLRAIANFVDLFLASVTAVLIATLDPERLTFIGTENDPGAVPGLNDSFGSTGFAFSQFNIF